MIVIFGWLKERQESGRVFDCYCYNCQRSRPWEHWRETEWVTFFAVKTLPFLRKNFVLCAACRDPMALSHTQFGWLAEAQTRQQLFDFLEDRQLAGKSEVQRRYLRSQRSDS